MSEHKNEGAERRSDGAGPKRSTVDAIFDALTSRTARALVVAQDVLTSAARWLDRRAKVVGELAAKLSPPPPAPPPEPPPSVSPAA